MNQHDNLEEFYGPANYDIEEENQGAPRIKFYVDLAKQYGSPVLDIACGSGLVALEIAGSGIEVTDIDLSPTMLEFAQLKAQQRNLDVTFIETNACHFQLNQTFSFIFLTGNAFQAFLGRDNQTKFLTMIKKQLRHNDIFAFETRNPTGHDLSDHDEAFWYRYQNVSGYEVTVSGSQQYDTLTNIMHWTTYRKWVDGNQDHLKTTRIACQFTSVEQLNQLLNNNGLTVIEQYGGLDKNKFTLKSDEIISICRLS